MEQAEASADLLTSAQGVTRGHSWSHHSASAAEASPPPSFQQMDQRGCTGVSAAHSNGQAALMAHLGHRNPPKWLFRHPAVPILSAACSAEGKETPSPSQCVAAPQKPKGVHSPGMWRGEASTQEIAQKSYFKLKIPKYYHRILEGLGGKGP